jgi:hypothetical protein
MKNQYLSTLLLLVLVFGVSSSVSAQNTSVDVGVDASLRTRVLQTEAQLRANAALRTTLEAQREKMRVEAEARRAEAQIRGDEAGDRREAARLEMEERRAEADARREAARVEAESRRAEAQSRRVEFQQDIAKRRVEHTARVILATIERLENIIERIESRIAKVKSGGGDTSESERFIAAANVSLSSARASVAAFVNIDLSSEQASENFERIRAAAAEAREHLRAAHQNLMLAVRSLHAVEIEVEIEAEIDVSVE